MVNAILVEKKLPSLLLAQATTKRKGKNEQMRNRYRLTQFKKRKPERFNSLNNELLKVLNEIDCELKKTCNS